MSNEQTNRPALETMRDDYRAVKAPRYLKTRIQAEVAGGRRRTSLQRWHPIAAGVTLALGLLVATPLLKEESGTRASGTPPLPSLAAASRVVPRKPATSLLSLSRLRTVKKPRLPTRPSPGAAPQTRHPDVDEFKMVKEIQHAKA